MPMGHLSFLANKWPSQQSSSLKEALKRKERQQENELWPMAIAREKEEKHKSN
jgi:hypothetical protein